MLVLGTHRSGTSIVTTALVQAQGFELGGPLLHVGDENPLGHFENEHVLAMHEQFLQEVGVEWSDLADPMALAGRRRRRAWVEQIGECCTEVARGADRFAVKDPRMLLVLPLWRTALRRQRVDVRALVTLRHPGATARSLHARNGLPLAHAEQIWLRDMRALQAGIGRVPHGVVRYGALVADPVRVLRGGFAAAGVPWDVAAEGAVRDLVDPALDRSRGEDADAPEAATAFAGVATLGSVRQWPRLGRS